MPALLIDALASSQSVIAAELRPPRAELTGTAGMDAWIDTYHSVRNLTRQGTFVFLTDSAVGTVEEDNLRHLEANLGRGSHRDRIVPFLTSKHPLDHCLAYASRANQCSFPSLVVLGGDRQVGPPRCVEHAWELRQLIRAREPGLRLGGWANPHGDAMTQVDYLLDDRFTAEFYLTQIVSHYDRDPVGRFIEETRRRGVAISGLFGVFYYRSANERTLNALRSFLPVPVEGLTREFGGGSTPEEVCARTIRALIDLGARHFYISNLPLTRTQATLAAILDRVGVTA